MATSPKKSKMGQPDGMNQETAIRLFEEGGILAFLDVPVGTEFGIDYNSWNVGPNFKGVKMIPPGVHFIFYSAVNKEYQSAPRTGFFHNFKTKEVLIKRWDKKLEDISTEVITPDEQERVESNRRELDRYLGAYPYESYKKWVSLTSYLRSALVEKLQPLNMKISSVAELQSQGSNTQSRKEAADAEAKKMEVEDSSSSPGQNNDSRLPDMKRLPGTEIRFTEIPKKKYPEGATPEQISKFSMDHSFVLQTLLDNVYGENHFDILGEIQLAFICFLLGQVYEGFEQWKQLVHLMCSCEELICKYPDLFNQFISILHYHIKEIPEDFFVDIVTRNNFLVSTLRSFFYNIEQSSANDTLKDKGKKFKENLEKKFKWDFSIEDEDDDPVVVELPEGC